MLNCRPRNLRLWMKLVMEFNPGFNTDQYFFPMVTLQPKIIFALILLNTHHNEQCFNNIYILCHVVLIFIWRALFIYSLFNDFPCKSDYTTSNYWMTGEWRVEKNVKEIGHGLIWGTTLAFAWHIMSSFGNIYKSGSERHVKHGFIQDRYKLNN
jgi:hypothetical protein